MVISALTLFFTPLNPTILARRQKVDAAIPILSLKGTDVSLKKQHNAKQLCERAYPQKLFAVCAVSSGVEDIEVSRSEYDDFSLTIDARKGNELKISIEVSGDKTQKIFDAVFSQMVADAQPIPGFRRVKGGW